MFNYCQSEIEGNGKCNKQCEHCIVYYKPLEDEKFKENLEKELTDFLIEKSKKLDVNLFKNAHELSSEFIIKFYPKKLRCKTWCEECKAFDWSYCNDKYIK